jgi:1-acyl-sn-glycerol-3-phosphate acyltransferase
MATRKLAANHVSWTDIHVLGALGNVAFIAKSEVAEWPVIGRLSRLQGTVFVNRNHRKGTGEQAREIGARLAAGDAMILFAEGTTADGNFILPFRSPLFGSARFALRTGGTDSVLVQPVAIAYTHFHGMPMGRLLRRHSAWIGQQELLPHLVQLLREGAVDVEVCFGEPIEYRDDADRKRIAREAEAQVRAMMSRALRDPLAG